MVVVPIPQEPKPTNAASTDPTRENLRGSEHPGGEKLDFIGLAAGGTLIAGALLLISGRRRAGMVTAVSGAALAMIGEQDTICAWWNSLPGFIDDVQGVLGKVQDAVNEVSVRRERLARILNR